MRDSQLGFAFSMSGVMGGTQLSAGSVPSILKWTGSKRSQAHSIARMIPEHGTYFEPFLGGGAVLFLATRTGAVAGDIYPPLIDFWKLVQLEPKLVVESYRREWQALQDNFPSHYYRVRTRFNKAPNALDLCFLTRTCVNGIVRFNANGEFNNSLHVTRPGMHPSRFAIAVRAWSRAVQGVAFVCGDYVETLETAVAGDFVYFDPPYAGTKHRYTSSLDISGFLDVLERLNSAKVRWALSFDGRRGRKDLTVAIPEQLYTRHLFLSSGSSSVGRVLNSANERVYESLYLNY